jgi:hypothetical protein
MRRSLFRVVRALSVPVMGLLVVGLLTATVLARTAVRDVVGKVIAVVPASRTIVMAAPVGKDVLTVGAEVPETASIRAGQERKTFSDVKVGDRIRMTYVREQHRLVVQSIEIQ